MNPGEETYHYGQGKVEIAERLSGGALGDWEWLGDVSELSVGLEDSSFSHRESYSGLKREVREIFNAVTASGSMTLHTLNTYIVALLMLGTATSQVAGTVTGESLGTVTVGDVVQLAHPGISSLVITDSAGSPVTIAATHYEVDAFGEIRFLTLPSSPAPTMPLLAAYSYSSKKTGTLLNRQRKEYALRYRGVNLAEQSKPCEVMLFKVGMGLLQTLSLITSGEQLASAPVSFKPLADTARPANDALGQFGYMRTVDY